MVTLTDEHLRALRFLARHRGGCTEEVLLAQGFTAAQLGWLVYAGLAKLRRGGGFTSAKVFREDHRGGTEGDRGMTAARLSPLIPHRRRPE
jgi:hypothetical protein